MRLRGKRLQECPIYEVHTECHVFEVLTGEASTKCLMYDVHIAKRLQDRACVMR